MELIELAKLMFRLRSAQKQYFKERIPSDLQKAKVLEKQVDAELAKLFSPIVEDDEIGLFGRMKDLRKDNAINNSGFRS
jgi:hypothetical protein